MKASDRIYRAIEEQIDDGHLLPGDPIDEEFLMTSFQVSRTPVREALLRLKAGGYVSKVPRSGIVVATMDIGQLLAIWELLADLEALCARYACQRMTDRARQELLQVHREAQPVVDAEDETGWRKANRSFHEVLYEGARNEFLREEIIRMRIKTSAYRHRSYSFGGVIGHVKSAYRFHGLITDAILVHDADAAAKAAFDHLSPAEGAKGVLELARRLPSGILD